MIMELQVGDRLTISRRGTVFYESDISKLRAQCFSIDSIRNMKSLKQGFRKLYKHKENSIFELIEIWDDYITPLYILRNIEVIDKFAICRKGTTFIQQMEFGSIILDMKHRRLMNINKLLDIDI